MSKKSKRNRPKRKEGKKRTAQPSRMPASDSHAAPKEGAQADSPPDEIADANLHDLGEQVPHLDQFWRQILRSVGTDPRDVSSIHGASGVSHNLIAAGIDEPGRRLVVVSGEPEARGAALAQADIQNGMSDFRVLLARPILFSAQDLALEVARATGRSSLRVTDLEQFSGRSQDEINATVGTQLQPMFGLFDQWLKNAQSLRSFRLLQALKQAVDQLARIRWEDPSGNLGADLTNLFGDSPGLEDLLLGTCGFPVFAFSGDEMESINAGTDPELIRSLLRKHNVLQYFFPAPDQLALGLLDRRPGTSVTTAREVSSSDRLGHPLGRNELVSPDVGLNDLLDALKDRKLIAEGEVSIEVTEEGRSVRQSVRFSPREGLVSKVLNRISVDIDLKDENDGLRWPRRDGLKWPHLASGCCWC